MNHEAEPKSQAEQLLEVVDPYLVIKLLHLHGLQRFRGGIDVLREGLSPTKRQELSIAARNARIVSETEETLLKQISADESLIDEHIRWDLAGIPASVGDFNDQEIDLIEQNKNNFDFIQIAYEHIVLPPNRTRMATYQGEIAAKRAIETVDVRVDCL